MYACMHVCVPRCDRTSSAAVYVTHSSIMTLYRKLFPWNSSAALFLAGMGFVLDSAQMEKPTWKGLLVSLRGWLLFEVSL